MPLVGRIEKIKFLPTQKLCSGLPVLASYMLRLPVAKLVNDKQLSLDKTLADYLPELVGRIENADKITLRMMVQHEVAFPTTPTHRVFGKTIIRKKPKNRSIWYWILLPILNRIKNIGTLIPIIC